VGAQLKRKFIMFDIIMCASPLSKKKPDESYQTEYDVAKTLTKVHLFDIYNIDSLVLPQVEFKKLVYHGWMMPPEYYTKFYNKCREFGYELINSPEQYVACHYFNGWYDAIEGLTPKSLIVEIDDLRKMAEQVMQFMHRNDCAVIIKDYVKSLKHMWNEACFIPKDSNIFNVCKVISTFITIKQDDKDLQGNLVVRKFVDFKQIGNHNKSGMPLAKEFRTFVLNGKPINTYNYWDQGNYVGDKPPAEFIQLIANQIFNTTKSNLFTIDVVQLKNNSWTCIEVGDGQVSAIPDNEDRLNFFERILK
jgi:hypothetical protein